jgi:uncharacterized protein (DUF111 family)
VTLELLRGAELRGVDADVELVTPTGVAILVGHRATFGRLPEITLHGIGVGGGARDTERPNVCRALIGERLVPQGVRSEGCVLLETNIDDQTPEGIGHAVETLVRDGALDAWVTSVVMKRSRPAFQLSVLVRPRDEARILDALFRATTTLGVRRRETTRWALDRSEVRVVVRGEVVRVKIGWLGDEIVTVSPEFQDCVELADRTGVSFKDIYAEATSAARESLRRRRID